MVDLAARADIAEGFQLFGEKNPDLLESSNGLTSIENSFNGMLNVLKNQLLLERYEFKEEARIQREIQSENKGIQSLGGDFIAPEVLSMLGTIASRLDNFGRSGGLMSVVTSLATAAAAAYIWSNWPDSETPEQETFDPEIPVDESVPTSPMGSPTPEAPAVPQQTPSTRDISSPTPNPPGRSAPAQTPDARTAPPSTSGGQRVPKATPHQKPSALKTAIKSTVSTSPVGLSIGFGSAVANKVRSIFSPSGGDSYSDSNISGTGYAAALNLISKGEGNYDSLNLGKKYGYKSTTGQKQLGRSLTDMTLREVRDLQLSRRVNAVGRYQIIRDSWDKAFDGSGLKMSDKFSVENQDKLGINLIRKRKNLDAYLKGKSNDVDAAMNDLASEWASFPDPKTGRSKYGGPNKVVGHSSVAEVRANLKNIRANFHSNDLAYTGFIHPLPGFAMSSKFGPRKDPFTGKQTNHKGEDIGAPIGTKVRASERGTVTRAERSSTYGNVIYISHGDGYQTRYAHLSKLDVKKNQVVTKGQIIGKVGNTGRSKAPHLHFEVLKDGKHLNPKLVVKDTGKRVADASTTVSNKKKETKQNNFVLMAQGQGHTITVPKPETRRAAKPTISPGSNRYKEHFA